MKRNEIIGCALLRQSSVSVGDIGKHRRNRKMHRRH
ncbi:unnamed protein product [Cylicostephanus goldi]|uniref:Uncharacterized protein n=1 Tax=Cylicostephanus goldi TaxID=71465 RepID=A0A3P6S0C7_CYLGO|nr:unnamed protein product [Cylicostephanus goldi]